MKRFLWKKTEIPYTRSPSDRMKAISGSGDDYGCRYDWGPLQWRRHEYGRYIGVSIPRELFIYIGTHHP